MSLERLGYIISLASDAMKKDISQPSERARVSAASVDRAARFNLVELQAIEVMLLNLSLRESKKPPSTILEIIETGIGK